MNEEAPFKRWIRQVRDTQENEIDCSECLEQLSNFVDLELALGEAGKRMPQVSQHLHQCTVCREEYEVLEQLARLEIDDALPEQADLIEKLKRNP